MRNLPAFKILLVDDCESYRMLIGSYLRRVLCVPIELIEATDGLEAIKKIPLCQPDLVITDTNMPRMDGIELLQFIRLNHESLKVVVLFGGLIGTPHLTSVHVEKLGASLVIEKAQVQKELLPFVRSSILGRWIFKQMKRTLGALAKEA